MNSGLCPIECNPKWERCPICTSYQFGGFGCGNSLVGGHIILGTQAKIVAKGSNSVYIMPICIQHNNDDNVYMEALKYLKGIWLKNYLGT